MNTKPLTPEQLNKKIEIISTVFGNAVEFINGDGAKASKQAITFQLLELEAKGLITMEQIKHIAPLMSLYAASSIAEYVEANYATVA